MGIHADMEIAGVYAVVFGARHRNEKGQDSQNQNDESDYEENLHIPNINIPVAIMELLTFGQDW